MLLVVAIINFHRYIYFWTVNTVIFFFLVFSVMRVYVLGVR
jgi:hypothetical protein